MADAEPDAPAARPETDHMKVLSRELTDRGNVPLRQFLADRVEAKMSWDSIALDLGAALRGTDYKTPRESVIKYARRYGLVPERGAARTTT